jgi:hypothetical protein
MSAVKLCLHAWCTLYRCGGLTHPHCDLQADVTCTQPELGAGAVKVIVVGSGQRESPLMTANVKMPLSEPDD